MRIFVVTIVLFSVICHTFETIYQLDSYFADQPEQGYDNITFPFAVGYTPNATGYMMTYNFTYSDSFLASISILPFEKDGNASLRVVSMSIAHENAFYSLDSACDYIEHDSILCWNEIPFTYGEPHYVILANTDVTRWEVIVAYEEDDRWELELIGKWRTQAASGRILGPVYGMLQYFNERFNISEDCSQLPEGFMYYANLIGGKTDGAYMDPVLSLACENTPFNVTRVSDGIFIDVAFEEKDDHEDPKDL